MKIALINFQAFSSISALLTAKQIESIGLAKDDLPQHLQALTSYEEKLSTNTYIIIQDGKTKMVVFRTFSQAFSVVFVSRYCEVSKSQKDNVFCRGK